MLCHKVSCTAVGKHLTDQALGSTLLHTKVGDDVSDIHCKQAECLCFVCETSFMRQHFPELRPFVRDS